MTNLSGKVAVIAGGAGAVGLATAKRFSALGASVVLLSRDLGKAQAALASLGGSASHLALRCDVTKTADLNTARDAVHAKYGACDMLVNTAGFTQPVAAANLEALTDELFDNIVQSNLRAVFATIRTFAPMLKASGDGLVVNVSSIAGFTGNGSNLAYVAAKAGLDILAESLAKVLAPQVRVLTVSPGVVDSAFVPGRGAEFNEKAAASTPLKRIGVPDDVAAAIEACAVSLRYATGTRLVIDGGRSLR